MLDVLQSIDQWARTNMKMTQCRSGELCTRGMKTRMLEIFKYSNIHWAPLVGALETVSKEPSKSRLDQGKG